MTLTVDACEDYGRRVVLILSTFLIFNKMHYSVLPRHFTLQYTDVMLLLCHV